MTPDAGRNPAGPMAHSAPRLLPPRNQGLPSLAARPTHPLLHFRPPLNRPARYSSNVPFPTALSGVR